MFEGVRQRLIEGMGQGLLEGFRRRAFAEMSRRWASLAKPREKPFFGSTVCVGKTDFDDKSGTLYEQTYGGDTCLKL